MPGALLTQYADENPVAEFGVRVMGAVGVVEFNAPLDVGGLCRRFAEEGCWIRPMGKVVYLTPPLVIGDDDLATLTGAIRRQVFDQPPRL